MDAATRLNDRAIIIIDVFVRRSVVSKEGNIGECGGGRHHG